MGIEAYDALFIKIESILDGEEKPSTISRELRDALLFYVAKHSREANGTLRKHHTRLTRLEVTLSVLGVGGLAGILRLVGII